MVRFNSLHANFSVNDLKAAKEFYVGKLGLTAAKELPGQMLLQAGHTSKVNIYEKEDHAPWDSTVLGIETDDVTEAVMQLQESGVEVAKLPGTDENGIMHDPNLGDAAWFQDPAKNWICVSNNM